MFSFQGKDFLNLYTETDIQTSSDQGFGDLHNDH